MNEEELIQRLQQLQIEENEVINQLAAIRSNRQEPRPTRQVLRIGDKVRLLTKGVRSKKGDLAVITKVASDFITIRLIATGHVTRRHPKNISKVEPSEP